MNLSLLVAFAVGLFSALHCIGMCGGVMGALSYGLGEPIRRSSARTFGYLLAYNAGRVASYTLAGVLAGVAGEQLVGAMAPGGAFLSLHALAALVLVGIGLHLAGWLPQLGWLERIGMPLWRRVEPLARRLLPVETPVRAFAYGAVWGWLPCGLVYVMLIASATRGSWVGGALYMLAFGVGTVPTLMAVGLLTGRLFGYAGSARFRRLAGSGIMVLGLVSLLFPVLLGGAQVLSRVP